MESSEEEKGKVFLNGNGIGNGNGNENGSVGSRTDGLRRLLSITEGNVGGDGRGNGKRKRGN
jgi:hypothetical protein